MIHTFIHTGLSFVNLHERNLSSVPVWTKKAEWTKCYYSGQLGPSVNINQSISQSIKQSISKMAGAFCVWVLAVAFSRIALRWPLIIKKNDEKPMVA